MKFDLTNPRTLSITAIMTALVLALTRSAVPNGIGYNHLGDIAIFFASFAFGPWVGLIAGGIGTALADVTLGLPNFAPLSLIVHGLEGFLAGYIYYKRHDMIGLILGVLAGGLCVVGGYFLGEYFVPVWGGPGQATTELPGNILQIAIGSIGVLVYLLVRRAYPQLGTQNAD